MRIVRNLWLIVRTVFGVMPIISVVFIIVALLSGFCGPLQIYATERLLDAGAVLLRGGDAQGVWLYGGLLVFSIFLLQLEYLTYLMIGSKRYATLEKNIPPRMMEKLMRTEYAAFEAPENQDILERIKKVPPFAIIHNGFGTLIVSIQTFVTIFGTMAMFIAVNPYLGLGVLVLGIPIYCLRGYTTYKQDEMWKATTPEARKTEYLNDLYADKNALYEMKMFGSGAYLRGLWNESLQRIFTGYKKIFYKISLTELAAQLLMVVFVFYTVLTLIAGIRNNVVSIGQFVSLIGALPVLLDRLYSAATSVAHAVRGALFMEDYRAFFALPEEESSEIFKVPSQFDITFEHVGFAYPGSGTEVLRNVHVHIPAGQCVALVGENGAGKSTIVRLLCGLYRPTRGRILIGGVDLQTLSSEARKKFLSIVFQDIQTYELTLRENIAFGNIEKLHDDDALFAALHAANAGYIAGKSPKGLDMELGKLDADGTDLSRGEWQRIAFARALISDAATVILDEPTAALDPIAESRMYQAFARVLKGRGALMISHRLASARLAHRILVLDGGTIVEDGTHGELVKRGGLYRRMYDAQSSWYRDSGEEVEI